MENNGTGQINAIEPFPQFNAKSRQFYGRLMLVPEGAPEGIERASQLATGSFDLVFYDGPNIYKEVRRVIDYPTDPSILVVNNGFHYGVCQAVKEVVSVEPRLQIWCRSSGRLSRRRAQST